jgi:hypothetical protein
MNMEHPTATPYTAATPLTIPQLEQVYDTLAQAIDHAGPQRSEIFLSKLSLLMANALGDPTQVEQLVQSALRDL